MPSIRSRAAARRGAAAKVPLMRFTTRFSGMSDQQDWVSTTPPRCPRTSRLTCRASSRRCVRRDVPPRDEGPVRRPSSARRFHGRPPERTSAARVHDPPARSARISRSGPRRSRPWAARVPARGTASVSDPALEGAAAVRSPATAARPEKALALNPTMRRIVIPFLCVVCLVPPSADADVIKFEPTQGVQTRARQPVLRIKPGDTVESRTFSKPGDYYEKDGGAARRSGRSSSKGCARRHARRPHHQSAPEPRALP